MELAGVYIPDRERQVMTLLAPDWVRAACERPHMVFLDEINAAVTRLHQAAAYQIVLERRVGPFEFHPDTVVMAAGNLDDDQSLTTPLSAALNNRFVHFTLKVEASAWLRWGEEQGVHPAVLGYVASKGPNGSKLLYDPTGHDAFPTPRSWAMASQLLQGVEDLDQPDNKRLIAACVGQAAAENSLRICGFTTVLIQRRSSKKARCRNLRRLERPNRVSFGRRLMRWRIGSCDRLSCQTRGCPTS